jgi:hypothetical protein
MFEEIFITVAYAICGSSVRLLWGVYKAEETFLGLSLSKKRLFFEFFVSFLFGIFGALVMNNLGIMKTGVDLTALVSGVLGANVIDVIAKKFGMSKKMEVIVSDQQLQFTEFNPREMNAMEYVRINGKITNQIYQKINRTTCDVAKYELQTLVSKKKLKKVGEKKGRFYVSL